MSLATHIKPISYLKANAAKIAQELKMMVRLMLLLKTAKPLW
jgi:hypothetical protein